MASSFDIILPLSETVGISISFCPSLKDILLTVDVVPSEFLTSGLSYKLILPFPNWSISA